MAAYQTGDILTARVNSLPLILHRGLVVVDYDGIYVWHNTPMKENQFGGSVVREPLETWLYDRQVVSVEKTNLTKDDIESVSFAIKEKPFHLFNFNCEHYVYGIKGNKAKSPQLTYWAIAGLGLLLIPFLRKK
jgi:hypothetical protein